MGKKGKFFCSHKAAGEQFELIKCRRLWGEARGTSRLVWLWLFLTVILLVLAAVVTWKRMLFHFALFAGSCRLTRGVCITVNARQINAANHGRRLLPKSLLRCFEFRLPSRCCLPQIRAARSFGGTTSHVHRVVQWETASKPGRHCRIVVPSDASALLHSAKARRKQPSVQKSLFG